MRFAVVRTIGLLTLLGACVGELSTAPGLFVLDDVGAGRWRTVSTGTQHSCAIDLDGRAWCWGSNELFQLGVDQTADVCGTNPPVACSLVPIPVGSGRSFSAISAGGSHTCAISTDSVPFCWGRNNEGQLGTPGPSTSVLRIPGTLPMISISAGATHACGVRVDNVLVCWGSNQFGAVGASFGTRVPPTTIAPNLRFTRVEASDERTCARTTAGRVLCWGVAWTHSSGNTNFTTVRGTPTLVAGLGVMSGMDIGTSSSCSVDPAGFVWCWDSNLNGEGGAGPGEGTTVPRRIATDEEFMSVSVGAAHVCAVAKEGSAYCWGSNRSLQLASTTTEYCGPAHTPCATQPLRIVGRQRFATISAGMGTHVCGVTIQANLYCWGSGSHGERGDGTRTAVSRVPRLAVGVSNQ